MIESLSKYSSVGTLIVTAEEHKVHVLVDHGIVALTRFLVPPIYKQYLKPQKYPPHITVIREEKWEIDLSLHGKQINFTYDPRVISGDTYWWLKVWSQDLINIRSALGLPIYSWACKPPDNEECFHITIGNTKK